MTREQLENLDRIYTRKLDVLTRIKDIDFFVRFDEKVWTRYFKCFLQRL